MGRWRRAHSKRSLNRLGQAAYLSVRDAETKRLFAPLESRRPVALAPDSAILMSEQYPIPRLETRVSSAPRVLHDAGPYLCFQSNQRYARKHLLFRELSLMFGIQTFSLSQSAGDGYRIRTKIERINIGT